MQDSEVFCGLFGMTLLLVGGSLIHPGLGFFAWGVVFVIAASMPEKKA